MTTATKPAAKKTTTKPAAKKVAPTRGGKRQAAGRKALDGATRIVTTSIGFTQKQLAWLKKKDGGASPWCRRMVDLTMAREEANAAKKAG